jgi:hypothetical protein
MNKPVFSHIPAFSQLMLGEGGDVGETSFFPAFNIQ